LRHHGSYSRVVGRGDNGVCPTEGVAPQQNPVGVDALVCAGECDSGTDIGELTSDIGDLPGFARAFAEAAVVEHQRGEACLRETFGIVEQPIHRSAEAVAEHHAGSWAGIGG
jgi:hypothetical protein